MQKTSQLIGKANRLVGFYIVWIFAEDCFRTEKKSFYYNNCGEFIPGENVDCRPIILLKKEILCRFFCVFCLNLSYICFFRTAYLLENLSTKEEFILWNLNSFKFFLLIQSNYYFITNQFIFSRYFNPICLWRHIVPAVDSFVC